MVRAVVVVPSRLAVATQRMVRAADELRKLSMFWLVWKVAGLPLSSWLMPVV